MPPPPLPKIAPPCISPMGLPNPLTQRIFGFKNDNQVGVFYIKQYAQTSMAYRENHSPISERYSRKSPSLKKVCCRRLPRWVMWWGIPEPTTRAIRAMAQGYAYLFHLSRIMYGVPRIPEGGFAENPLIVFLIECDGVKKI